MTKKPPKDMTEFFQKTSRMGGKIGGKLSLLTIGARMESASTAEGRSERVNKAAAASAEARKKGARQRLFAAGPTLEASPVPASKPQALILAHSILNPLLGYSRKGSRARKDFYRNALPTLAPGELNWIAEVWMRVEAREHDPLRPTPYGQVLHGAAVGGTGKTVADDKALAIRKPCAATSRCDRHHLDA